jgi:hypothetical protein
MNLNNTIIQEYSKIVGINEKDLLNELRGFYKPSFFHIYLKGDYNEDFGALSKKDKGTFIHEYIHYIQNIATYWGLFCSITRYQELINFKSHIIHSEKLEIPLKMDYGAILKCNIRRVICGKGLSFFNEKKSWNINRSLDIVIEKDHSDTGQDVVYLIIAFDDDRREKISLGAHIIKESMAAMYQGLIDTSTVHDDVPYNLVKVLCEQHFPNISNDIEKLICICHTSLFSTSPGYELMSLLNKANKDLKLDGLGIFRDYVNNSSILASGKRYNMFEYFDILISNFRKYLATNLNAELDYIDEVLNRISLKNDVPFLTILYDQNKLSTENINNLVGYFGIPYIQTLNNGFYYPKSTREDVDSEESTDVIELIAQDTMFSYMTNPARHKICPLYYMCGQSEYNKNECFDTPWKGTKCVFTIVSSPFSLNTKEIVWKF